jgi:hypothetical protein
MINNKSWVIQDCSTAVGGIEYERLKTAETAVSRGRRKPWRAKRSGKGLAVEHQERKIFDNVEICTAVDGVVKKVDYVLRKYCARTPLGWVADNQALSAVRSEVEEIRKEAWLLNVRAKLAKSARSAYICVVPLTMKSSAPEAPKEIARTIKSVLTALLRALRGGELSDLHKLKIRARNLHKLAVGRAAAAIKLALDRVPVAANEIREATRSGEMALERAAYSCDLTAIEEALSYFDHLDFEFDFVSSFDAVG